MALSEEGLYNRILGSAGGLSMAAAVDRAAQYLPLPRRASPPPILATLRLQSGEDVHLSLPPHSTLQQLRSECQRASGVPQAMQGIVLEEQRPASSSGLVSALRTTASQLTSRERLRESLVDWVNFIFLPEAVNREVRGRGLLSWFRENVLPHLLPPPPSSVAIVTLRMLGGRRMQLELSATATLQRLYDLAERQYGLPPDCLRLVVVERPKEGPLHRLFWAAVRLAFVVGCLVAGVAAAGARWVFLGPCVDQSITLKLHTGEGGEAVDVSLRQDVTLRQLQHALQLQHGDHVQVQGLVLGGSSSSNSLGDGRAS